MGDRGRISQRECFESLYYWVLGCGWKENSPDVANRHVIEGAFLSIVEILRVYLCLDHLSFILGILWSNLHALDSKKKKKKHNAETH